MDARTLLVTLVAVACLGCRIPTSPERAVTFEFDFANGVQGWVAGFAEYPADREAFFELVADYRPLPPSLAAGRSALYISGNNRSDDLFMFYKRRVAGLTAAGRYEARIEVEIATDVSSECGGVGGSPGESVYVKAGIGRFEPTLAIDASGSVQIVNFDKGNQAVGGTNALVLGTVGNSQPCEISDGRIVTQWELKPLRTPAPIAFRADDAGAAWMLVGTDSGFESTTSLYYTRVVVTILPLPN